MIKVEHLGYSYGQHDFKLKFMIDNEEAGYIDYSEYEKKPYVKMIKVHDQFQRMGIARRMITHLQSLYDEEINLGMLTDDGHKLISSLKTKKVENPFYDKVEKQLEKLNTTLERYSDLSKNLNSSDDIDKKRIMDILSNWNSIHDKCDILNDWLSRNKRYKTFFI